MPFTTSAGTRLYWKLEGVDQAPALVLLNSIGTDMDLWAEALPHLRPHFRLLRIDTRGHGASDGPAGDYDLGMLASDVVAIMDDAGIAGAGIAGVSLGGMVAMQMAHAYPERVSGLSLICTSATMDREAWSDRVNAVRRGGMAAIADLAMTRFLSEQARPDQYATIKRGLERMNPDGYAGCAAAIRDMALRQYLVAFQVPTLVVTGDRDLSTPLAGHGEHLVAEIPGAILVQLQTAHLAPIEAPAELARAIVETLGANGPPDQR